jgi:hypothetical protein
MAETRPLPTNYWTQRKTRTLTPSDRHVGAFLWTNRNTNSCGVYQIDVVEVALATGYDATTTQTHMENLVRNGHILWDEETSEIFILDWFRYHKFKGAGKSILIRDINRIESKVLMKAACRAIESAGILLDQSDEINIKQILRSPTQQNGTQLNTTTTSKTNGLNFSFDFSQVEMKEILNIISSLEQSDAQILIDEICAMAREKVIRKSPVSLMNALKEKLHLGKFSRSYSIKVSDQAANSSVSKGPLRTKEVQQQFIADRLLEMKTVLGLEKDSSL